MSWYPLELSTPTNYQFFGGERIRTQLGKPVATDRPLSETWEVSDVEGAIATVQNGEFAGQTLRELVEREQNALLGAHWHNPPHFPLLLKFIDGTGMFPVHVHADDDIAQREHIWPHGKTESWHILWAAPGATLLAGVRAGIDKDVLQAKLLEQAYDEVMVRHPVQAGDTFYVPAGTLHSFGPGILLAEIQQTADILEHAMPWVMDTGEPISREQWQAGVEATVAQVNLDAQSAPQPGLVVQATGGVERRLCCAGPYFATERIRFTRAYRRTIDRAVLLANIARAFTLRWPGGKMTLARAQTVVLPAALDWVSLEDDGECLIYYVPELKDDVIAPLRAAGYAEADIEALGDVHARHGRGHEGHNPA